MFGNEPGAERRLGVMNQHVVTKLPSYSPTKRYYWVLHTRGEAAVSVLIQALSVEAKSKKMPVDQIQRLINDVVGTIDIANVILYPTVETYNRVKDTMVVPWGAASGERTLESLVSTAKGSGVIAYNVVTTDDE